MGVPVADVQLQVHLDGAEDLQRRGERRTGERQNVGARLESRVDLLAGPVGEHLPADRGSRVNGVITQRRRGRFTRGIGAEASATVEIPGLAR